MLASAAPASGLEVVCANGITAHIHTATDLAASWLEVEGDRLFLDHPASGYVELLTGPDDPRLLRSAERGFFPFDPAVVGQALADMDGIAPVLEVDIFILPTPVAAIQKSFARKGTIFLSPGFAPVPSCSIAYIVTHEMGHVLTWAYMDRVPSRWQTYLQLRGLTPAAGGQDVVHASRVREILAEDIRFLFGGRLATFSGTIENHTLQLPDQVPGLRETLAVFFQGEPLLRLDLLPSRAYPNPCNPVTTVQMRIPAGSLPTSAQAVLTIYDLQGRLLRRIEGDSPDGDLIRVPWRGRNDAGLPVASGRYLYVLYVGDLASRGSIQLVR